MAMTNAERQKRYRDRKRGGPPRGRWGDHGWTQAQLAAGLGIGRTMVCMVHWLGECGALEELRKIEAGRGKVTPIYKRLRADYERGLCRALLHEIPGRVLTCRREDGAFLFEWVDPEEATP